jgi:hypothetical protein
MRTNISKWASIAALLLAVAFWDSAPAYQLALDVIVSAAAGVVVVQAFQVRNYWWGGAFVATALLFNPLVPVFPLAGRLSLLLVLTSTALFAVSLAALKPQPLLSIPSITNRTPGSRSL